eukprot:Skav227317  [mRNA]  locus=scaffold826:57499:62414:+ [translate_table: standard]
MRKMDVQCAWSAPVAPYSQSKAELRGLAGGTAAFSAYPLRPSLEAHPTDIVASNRYCEVYVQFAPHRFLLFITLYGPTSTCKLCDPCALRNRIFTYAAQRAVRRQGPAVINGDMNAPLSSLDAWKILSDKGWVDAAFQSSKMNGHPLEPTSTHSARHTFILTTPDLGESLLDCRTTKHSLFAVHPVLHARFRWPVLLSPKKIWSLPRSFDAHIHDPALAVTAAAESMLQSQHTMMKAIQHEDTNEMARIWTHAAEQALAKSVVDAEGHVLHISQAYLGRFSKSTFKTKHFIVPKNKKARDGEPQPLQDQSSILLRRHMKQVHRLHSLCRQVKSLRRVYSHVAFVQAQHLWKTIFFAKGFFPSFAAWVFDAMSITVSQLMPDLETIQAISEAFQRWHRANDMRSKLEKTKNQQLDMLADLQRGGKIAFARAKLPSMKPLNQIHSTVKAPVPRMRWTKAGHTFIPGKDFHVFDINLPDFAVNNFSCQRPLHDEMMHHVFTDGSAFFNDIAAYTMSAAAIVEVPYLQYNILQMERFPVNGLLQNSYMGELNALTVALDHFHRVTIYMDCQSIIDHVQQLQHDPTTWPTCSMASCPLWIRIRSHIQLRAKEDIVIIKVAAHQRKPDPSDAYATWIHWGNEQADKNAKEAITHDARATYLKVHRAYQRCIRNREDLHILYKVAIQANKLCNDAQKTTLSQKRAAFQLDTNHDSFRCPATRRRPFQTLPNNVLLAYPWGAGFLWRIMHWANRLTWPQPGDTAANGDISFLELLIDFVVCTGSWPPRNISSQSQRNSDYGIGRWTLDDDGTRADIVSQPLASYSAVWKRAMVWLMQHAHFKVLHGDIIKRTQSLAQMGCSAWHAGISVRPHLTAGYRAAHILSSYFVTPTGCVRTLDKILTIDNLRPLKIPATLQKPFIDRLPLILEAKHTFHAYHV